MSRFSIQAFSVFPYYTKSNAATQEEKWLQKLLYALKEGGGLTDGDGNTVMAIEWFSSVLKDSADELADVIGPGRQIVPVPSSSVTPLPPKRKTWPMYDLAVRLQAAGLARSAHPLLTRRTAVAKSHAAGRNDRTSVLEHRDSLAVDATLLNPDLPITLLDDVLTYGTAAMGCLLALQQAGYEGDVRLLTATHTVAADYSSGATAAARSEIIWFDDKDWRLAWRPKENVSFV